MYAVLEDDGTEVGEKEHCTVLYCTVLCSGGRGGVLPAAAGQVSADAPLGGPELDTKLYSAGVNSS